MGSRRETCGNRCSSVLRYRLVDDASREEWNVAQLEKVVVLAGRGEKATCRCLAIRTAYPAQDRQDEQATRKKDQRYMENTIFN